MPQRCRVCGDSERDQVDSDILSGAPNRRIASRVGCSEAAVRRHAAAHLTERLKRAHAGREIASGDSLATKLLAIEAEARRLGQKAEKAGDLRTALLAVRELVRLTELAARVSGELEPAGVTVNIVASTAWVALRGRILAALAPFPDARLSVAKALRSAENA
jgi:hypothetical protein